MDYLFHNILLSLNASMFLQFKVHSNPMFSMTKKEKKKRKTKEINKRKAKILFRNVLSNI